MSMEHGQLAKAITLCEVAHRAGVPPATLHRWLSTGKLRWPKTVVTHGRVLFLWEEQDIDRVRVYNARIHLQARYRKRELDQQGIRAKSV